MSHLTLVFIEVVGVCIVKKIEKTKMKFPMMIFYSSLQKMQSHSSSNRLDFDRQFVTNGWRGNIFRCERASKSYCLKKAISPEFQSNLQREILLLEKIQSL